MAEKGLPEQTIMAQVGHVSPQILKTYSYQTPSSQSRKRGP